MLFKCIVKGKKQVRDCYNSIQSHDHILQKNKNKQTIGFDGVPVLIVVITGWKDYR